MKFNWKQSVESMTVAMVLVFILLPIRVFFVRFISSNWFGSFGVITAISLLVIYLAKKNKLGWFGRAFHRQMFKIHRGKRRYFVYAQLVLGTIFFAVTIHAINVGNEYYDQEKTDLLNQLEIKSVKDFMDKTSEEEIKPEVVLQAFYVLFYILIFRFDIFSIMISSMNDVFDGWVMHFSTVFLVEEIELIAIAIITRFAIKTEKPTNS